MKEVYLGIVRVKSDRRADKTWVQVRASKIKKVIEHFERMAPEEVRGTVSFKLIPWTMHEGWDEWRSHGSGTASIGFNGYRSMTTAELAKEAADDKAKLMADIDGSAFERAEYERLRKVFG